LEQSETRDSVRRPTLGRAKRDAAAPLQICITHGTAASAVVGAAGSSRIRCGEPPTNARVAATRHAMAAALARPGGPRRRRSGVGKNCRSETSVRRRTQPMHHN